MGFRSGCHSRTSANQKPPGRAKVHYGRRTFQRPNGAIHITHLRIQRHDDTTRNQDHVCLPSMNRPTDQVRHAEHEATAMDAHAVVIHGHRFHHSTVMTALDAHSQVSHAAAVDAIAAHDGHVNAGNINYNDI